MHPAFKRRDLRTRSAVPLRVAKRPIIRAEPAYQHHAADFIPLQFSSASKLLIVQSNIALPSTSINQSKSWNEIYILFSCNLGMLS
jgi:hypothetical protein